MRTLAQLLFSFQFLLLVSLCFSSLNAQTNVSGNVSGTWTAAESPYVLTASVTVPTGMTLSIEPGVEVHFPNFSTHFNVNGTLNAQGTATDSIEFIGFANPAHSPNSTHGGRIDFTDNSINSVMNYVVVNRLGDLQTGGNALHVESSSFTISHSFILNSEENGIFIGGGNNPSPGIFSNRFEYNNSGLSLSQNTSGTVSGNHFANNLKGISAHPSALSNVSGNFNADIYIPGGVIAVNTTWGLPGSGSNYFMDGAVNVNQGITLTIAAGVEIKSTRFNADLNVSGRLLAPGTTTDSIKFIGIPNPSYYNSSHGGEIYFSEHSFNSIMSYVVVDRMGDAQQSNNAIRIESSSVILSHCFVRNSEANGTLVEEGSPSIMHCRFENNVNGLLLYANSSASIVSNHFANNTNGIQAHPSSLTNVTGNFDADIHIVPVNGGSISANATWPVPGAGCSYFLDGSVGVNQGITLTIDAGVEIKVTRHDASLSVSGTLKAKGTSSDSIRFIGLPNPVLNTSHGGRIIFDDQSIGSEMDYVVIDNMGEVQNVGTAVQIESSSCQIKNTRIINSELNGLTIADGASVILNQCTFSNNQTGIIVHSGNSKFINCNIYNNTLFGLNNIGQGIIDARSCWWGFDTGPFHPTSNPNGQGNKVSNRVWFNPWRQQTVRLLTIGSDNPNTLPQAIPTYFSLSVPDSLDGATFRIRLLSDATTGVNELYAQNELYPLRGQATYNAVEGAGTQRDLYLFGIPAGAYYVAVFPTGTGVQNVQVSVTVLGFTIITANPAKGGNSGSVTLKISGSNFEPNMSVRLEDNGNIVATATNLTFPNIGEVFATFDLNGKPVGYYDLVIENTLNDTAHWSQPFQIDYGDVVPGLNDSNVPGCSRHHPIADVLRVSMESPVAGRTVRPVPVTIHFENTASYDIPLPRRILSSERGMPLAYTAEDINSGTPTLLIEFKEPGGPTDILRAGVQGTIVVYARLAQSGDNQFKLLR